MDDLSYAVIGILYCIIGGVTLFFVSSCLLSHEGRSKESAVRRVIKYLTSGPITLVLSLLISSVYIFVTLSEKSEQARLAFGLPNDSVWAFIIYVLLTRRLFSHSWKRTRVVNLRRISRTENRKTLVLSFRWFVGICWRIPFDPCWSNIQRFLRARRPSGGRLQHS